MPRNEPDGQNPLSFLLRQAFDSLLRSMMVCLPGKVVLFDAGNQTAQVECGIQRIIDGQGVTIPVIENVPVHFAGSDQWYFWHEVKPGTEGLIHFSQRAIDLWIERGGPVKPHDTRMFSAEDAFFVPGVRSRPGKIPNFTNQGIGMSDYAGQNFIHVKDGSIDIKTTTLNINATTINENGNVTHQGNMTRTGDTALTGGLTNNGKDVGGTHKHSGVTPGGGQSGEPI